MRDIAAKVGLAAATVRRVLRDLVDRGEVERIAKGEYRLAGDARRPGVALVPYCRPTASPTRDAILAFLDRLHHAKHVAERIRRTVPTATAHLQAMLRLGLVRRLKTGVYVRSGAPPRTATAAPAAIVRSARQAELVAFLAEGRTADEIAARFPDRLWVTVQNGLVNARKARLVALMPDGRYAAVGGIVARETRANGSRRRKPATGAARRSYPQRRGPGKALRPGSLPHRVFSALAAIGKTEELLAEEIDVPRRRLRKQLAGLLRRGWVVRCDHGVCRRA